MRLHALRSSCKPFLPVRSVGKGPFYRNAGRSIVRPCALLKPAEGYKITWKQTTDEVNIKVPVRNNVRGRDVDLEIHPHRLSLKVGGEPVLVGSLEDCGSVDLDGCFFVMESDKDGRYIALTLAKKEMGYESWSDLLTTDVPDLSITDKAYLDVQIGDGKTRRIVVGLYGNVVPRTVANFRDLCTGEGKDGVGDPLQYKGSPFHRIIPGFMAQGGDITEGDGTGGQSIYGASFEDENFKLKHDSAGVVAMANAGPNTNNSQFYITLAPQPHLDGKHVVFGKVEEGMAVLKLMEEVGTAEGQPTKEVKIVDCGVLKGEASPAQS